MEGALVSLIGANRPLFRIAGVGDIDRYRLRFRSSGRADPPLPRTYRRPGIGCGALLDAERWPALRAYSRRP